jgi:DNA-binding HxlR family transcriptional regulator
MGANKYNLEGVGNDNCPTRLILSLLEGKWKILILYHLFNGEKRPSELERHIPDASRQVLTSQLRELETDGLIEKTIYAQVPPRVEYTLTPFGQRLEPLLDLLFELGQQHAQQIKAKQQMALTPCEKNERRSVSGKCLSALTIRGTVPALEPCTGAARKL